MKVPRTEGSHAGRSETLQPSAHYDAPGLVAGVARFDTGELDAHLKTAQVVESLLPLSKDETQTRTLREQARSLQDGAREVPRSAARHPAGRGTAALGLP